MLNGLAVRETDSQSSQISPSASISDPQTALVAPNTDPDSLDLVCGRNASVSWAPIKTAVIQAGDTIGFGIGEPVLSVCRPSSSKYLSLA